MAAAPARQSRAHHRAPARLRAALGDLGVNRTAVWIVAALVVPIFSLAAFGLIEFAL